MRKILCPSILNLGVEGLKEQIQEIDRSDIDIFHLDLMDGTFVPNFGMSMREIDVVRKYTEKPIDCHMMIMNPGRYIEMMAQHGIDIVYIHPESELIPSETLDKIHRLGMKAGIVVNPCTSIAGIKPLLPQCEYVMMMGVNPGFAGRDFMDYLVPKFKEISDLRQQEKQDFHIILDGGADRRVISMLYHDCGIEGYVLGKQMYFFQEKSYAECAKEIREI